MGINLTVLKKGIGTCMALMMGVGMSNLERVIREESEAFEKKQTDLLFDNYYSPDLKVYLLDSSKHIIEMFEQVRATDELGKSKTLWDPLKLTPLN